MKKLFTLIAIVSSFGACTTGPLKKDAFYEVNVQIWEGKQALASQMVRTTEGKEAEVTSKDGTQSISLKYLINPAENNLVKMRVQYTIANQDTAIGDTITLLGKPGELMTFTEGGHRKFHFKIIKF